MTERPKNIDEVILLFQKDPPVLVKDKSGQVGNQKTKYADLGQANDKVLSRLNALGVTYVCLPNLADDGKFTLEYELLHVASGTAKRGKYPLKLSENPMQMGSAITYARRYALLSTLGIVAEDEDDDGRQAGGRPTAQRGNRPEQRADRPASGNTAQRASTTAPPLPGEDGPALITKQQMARMQALFAEEGIEERADKLAYANKHIDRVVGSATELTTAEAGRVINALAARSEAPDGAGIPADGGEAS